MKFSDNENVNKFMDDLQTLSFDKFEIIESIRKIFHSANIELIEDIKYGGLVFNLSNILIGGIFPYKGHISIEFSNGVDFPDPAGMLEGKGKKRRHLKIVKKQDIDTKSVDVFVAEAVKV
jgi:hypothetical protein